jgi:hypothetical protein
MRSTASSIYSDRTMNRHLTDKGGQGQLLRGAVLVLWLLPELDLNQQPCD